MKHFDLRSRIATLFFLVMILLGSGVVFAGGGSEAITTSPTMAVNPPGTFPIVDEPITMSVFFGYSATIEDYKTNEFTLWFEKLTNIKLDFIVAPTDAMQRLSLMMSAASDMPDMITSGLTMASTMSYGSQGLIIPLGDLIDRYSVSLEKILDARPHLLNIMRAPDGKIYHLPGLNECWHCEYVPKAFVAVEWMKKLGLDMPDTTEELYNFLKAFKEGDPNGNGLDDEVPLTGSDRWWAASVDQFLMQPFLYYPSRTGLWVENEKIYAPFVTEGWKEGVRFMRRLYAEGLIDSEVFVQDGTQFAALVDSEPMIAGVYTAGWAGVVSPNGERIWEYDAVIPPLTGPDGIKRSRHNPSWGGGPAFAITKSNKNPEAAFRWADALYDQDIQLNLFYGLEGSGWRQARAGDIGLDGKQARYQLLVEWGTPNNIRWEHMGIPAVTRELRAGEAMVDMPGVYPGQRLSTKRSLPYVGYEPSEYLPPLTMTLEETREVADLTTSINPFVEQSFVKFVTGAANIDTEFDDYVRQLRTLNLNRLIEITQAVFDRQWKGFDFSYMGGMPGQ